MPVCLHTVRQLIIGVLSREFIVSFGSLLSMVFFSNAVPLTTSKHSWIPTGLDTLMIAAPPRATASILDQIFFHGVHTSKRQSPAQVLEQNTGLLLTQLSSFFGFNPLSPNLVSSYHNLQLNGAITSK